MKGKVTTTTVKGYAKFGGENLEYRYLLGRIWDPEAVPLVWIMINPSTANAFRDDPTIRAVTAFTSAWGYGGFWVVNLFAYRTPEPEVLRLKATEGYDIVGSDNDTWIRKAVKQGSEPVAAWGRNGRFYPARIRQVTDMLAQFRSPLRCIGTTRGGHPRHPLLAPAASTLQPWSQENVIYARL